MELLHQFFVKLGARYVVITNIDGLCMSLITHVENPTNSL